MKTEDPSIVNYTKLEIKATDSLYAEMTQYFDEDTSSASPSIPFQNFVNRMAFWMATGSGKSLVIIKLIEILDNLMKKDLIPTNNILILTENDGLQAQIKKTIDNSKNYFQLIPNIIFVLQQFYQNYVVALLQQIFSLDFSLFYWSKKYINNNYNRYISK